MHNRIIKLICNIVLAVILCANFSTVYTHGGPIKSIECANVSFSDKYSNVFHNKKNSSMKIALTFDDGPHPIYTPAILDILEEYNVKATFFMVGENIQLYPDVAMSVLKHGHEIGNHTYTHPHIVNMGYGTLVNEILDCEDIVFELYEYKPKLFRPPEGMLGKDILSAADKLEYNVILWNVDTRDWANTPPDKIVDNVMKNTDSGDIILMHDYISHNSPTPEALKKYIPMLIEKGFDFVTVSELIASD